MIVDFNMATAVISHTNGVLGMWNGTKDGEEGYIGTANLHRGRGPIVKR